MRRLGWKDPGIGAETREKAPAGSRNRSGLSGVANLTPNGTDAATSHVERQEPTRLERAAATLGIDLDDLCPVCRGTPASCQGCNEEDRNFIRRTRFEANAKTVARCQRCAAPLSVIYVPKPKLTARTKDGPEPFSLSQFVAVYGCSFCQGDALAAVAMSVQTD